jgi:hypothetical protein
MSTGVPSGEASRFGVVKGGGSHGMPSPQTSDDPIVESFEAMHALPDNYEVYDTQGGVYRRDREGLWADRWGHFPASLENRVPLRSRPISEKS